MDIGTAIGFQTAKNATRQAELATHQALRHNQPPEGWAGLSLAEKFGRMVASLEAFPSYGLIAERPDAPFELPQIIVADAVDFYGPLMLKIGATRRGGAITYIEAFWRASFTAEETFKDVPRTEDRDLMVYEQAPSDWASPANEDRADIHAYFNRLGHTLLAYQASSSPALD